MNFFERQRHVRRMSGRLVLLFALAVIGIVIVINLVLLWAFNAQDMSTNEVITQVLLTTGLVVASIFLAALFRTLALKGGGGVVARSLGGVLVPVDTQDPQLRRLRNVVEEIAIASGVTVPEIYVLPHEDAINAFAAGWSTSDAAVAVTRGSLERLNRAELQGVIAHEFSHVINGDMRLNIRLMGLLFGILFLAVIGRTFTNVGILGGGRRDDKSQGNPLVIVGITLLIVGFIGVFFGRLIKAAVSRQREYLADASAVQFTRQTSGLVGALSKIAGLEAGSKLRSPKTEEVGHMLFGSGASFSALFATHPPLADRIKVLDPTFDQAKLAALSRQWAAQPPSGLQEDISLGFAAAPATALHQPQTQVPVAAATVVADIAAPSEGAFAKAEQLIGQIPPAFLDRAHDSTVVAPLILGLLMADDAEARGVQHAKLIADHGRQLGDDAWGEANALANLHPLLRLPLAELAVPALRQLPVAAQSAFLNQVFTLINADGRVTVYEYCLSRLIYNALTEAQQPKSGWRVDRNKLDRNPGAVATLLAVLAQAGNSDAAQAERAFQAGLAKALPGMRLGYTPPAGVTVLEQVWPALADLPPEDTQRLVEALVSVIAADGVTTVTELELLRTICAIQHAPLPL